MNQRVRVVRVNDEFEFNLNKLLSEKWEIYKMYHDRVIMFKEFLNENELEQFDAEYFS